MKKLFKLFAGIFAIGLFAFCFTGCANDSSSSGGGNNSAAKFISSDKNETVTFNTDNTFSVFSNEYSTTIASGTYDGDITKNSTSVSIKFTKWLNENTGKMDDVDISKTIDIQADGMFNLTVKEGVYSYKDTFTRVDGSSSSSSGSGNDSTNDSGSGSSSSLAGFTYISNEVSGSKVIITFKTSSTLKYKSYSTAYPDYAAEIDGTYSISGNLMTISLQDTPQPINVTTSDSWATFAVTGNYWVWTKQ